MRELGIGMIGYGFMGKMHSYCYMSLPFIYDDLPARTRLVGVATSTEASRELAIERAGYEFSTDDFAELLKREDIHIIDVATPNYLHREQVIAAVKAGKHVYCDKPLAMNAVEAAEMAELARQAGTTCQITFHNRFAPATMRARQMVEDGFLGEIVSFRAAYLHSGYTDPNRPMSWRMRFETSGGGAVMDLGSHIIDLVRWLAGDFTRVQANMRTLIKERPVSKGSSQKEPVTVDDMAVMQLEMPNGSIGTIEASRIATGVADDLRFEIHGTKGALMYNLMEPEWLWVYDDTKPGGVLGGEKGFTRIECLHHYPQSTSLPGKKNPLGWTRMHIASVYDFVHRAANGLPGDPSFDDGVAVHKVIDAAMRSNESGRWEGI